MCVCVRERECVSVCVHGVRVCRDNVEVQSGYATYYQSTLYEYRYECVHTQTQLFRHKCLHSHGSSLFHEFRL